MDSGPWIKQQLAERFIKASDVEHLSRSIADAKGNSDYYVSHATLADIAAGSIPSIYTKSSGNHAPPMKHSTTPAARQDKKRWSSENRPLENVRHTASKTRPALLGVAVSK
jgi:hypothetical protein